MYDLGPDFDDATVAPGTNVLVAGPPLSGKRRLAMRALEAGADAGEGSIVITTRDDAERVLSDVRPLVDDLDERRVGVVDCVTNHQGGSATDGDLVKYTSSPVDMTGIGIEFAEFVEDFYTERDVRRNRVMVDSLSTLLMYSDLETVFRFMHVFTSRIDSAEAIGLHVIESTAHDEETMNTLVQLFDGVVRTDEDGEVTLQLDGVE